MDTDRLIKGFPYLYMDQYGKVSTVLFCGCEKIDDIIHYAFKMRSRKMIYLKHSDVRNSIVRNPTAYGKFV